MGTGLILFGFLFLINPELITVDVFPDFIGYLLIAAGLRKLSFLEERIALGRKFALLLALSSVAKLFSSLIAIPTQIESTRLTVSFVFLVCDGWLSYLFVNHTFKGIQYLASRHNGELVLKSYEVAKTYCMVFFLAKQVIHFLPQGVAAVFPHIDADPDQVENYRAMVTAFQTSRSVLFVAGSAILIALGIYTALIVKAYVKRCREDAPFVEAIRFAYGERVGQNENMKARIAVRSAFRLFFVATVFLFDLYVDGVCILPTPVFSILILLGLKRLSSSVSLPCWYLPFSWGAAAVTVGAYGFRFVCLFAMEEFGIRFPTFLPAYGVGIANAVVCALSGLVLFGAVKRVCQKYSEFSYRLYGILLPVAVLLLSVESVFPYLFLAEPVWVTVAVWVIYAALLYFHKKSLDEMQAEIEYKLM